MAAPSYLSAGTALLSAFPSGTHAVPYPATVDAGDRLLLALAISHGGGTVTVTGAPSGFTAFSGNPYTTTEIHLFLFEKDAAGTEDGTTVSVTLSTSGTMHQIVARMWRFSACGTKESLTHTPYASLDPIGPGPTVTPGGSDRIGACIVQIWNDRPGLTPFAGATPDRWAEQTENNGPDHVTLQLQTADLGDGSAISGGNVDVPSAGGASQAVSWAWPAAVMDPVYEQSDYRFYNDDGTGLGEAA